MISAKVIADSKNQFGNRITTMIVVMPRYILAEFNTHRMLSRNSASSRAIPFQKNLKNIEENPFIPIAWMRDHKGMQGSEYITDEQEIHSCKQAWLLSRDRAVNQANMLSELHGVTKQLVNRLLEPFMWHTVIVTATEWENFFALRCPQYYLEPQNDDGISTGQIFRSKKDVIIANGGSIVCDDLDWLKMNKGQADIHMMTVAEAMWDAYNESTPRELKAGEWHIPFGDNILIPGLNGIEQNTKDTIKIATARCARVSYTIVGEEGKPDNYEADIKLHDRLAISGHWSPMEHCAQAMGYDGVYLINDGFSGNFRGFIQYRKTFQNENITK